MSSASSPSGRSVDPLAQQLYSDFRRQVEGDAKLAFDCLCVAHPEHAERLREMCSRDVFSAPLAHEVAHADTIFAPLRERYGDSVRSSPGLDDETEPTSATETKLLEKLRAVGPRGTRYKLLGEIARGGMGAIIRVRDGELNRTLAMKVILGQDHTSTRAALDVDPQTLGRFLEEAQITGQLDHPGIVPVHELGLDATGRAYFTMKLVKGEDLRNVFEHVRTGHEGWNQVRALGVILKVCEAMAFAHSKKVVHRDLKPANVMVGKFGEVFVMDWGLARVLGREDKHDLRLKPQSTSSPSVVATERHKDRESTPDSPLVTMDGDVVGTPSFMPPEQARGELDRLGPHSDVYSIGAMLYQLVTGEMPYVPAGTRVSQHTILLAVLREPPPAIERLAPATPPELVAICEKAMERDVALRYPDTLSFAADLRAYLEGRVVAAYETGRWAETKKWLQRNKSLAAALATAVLAMLGGIVFSASFAREANEERKRTSSANVALDKKNAEVEQQRTILAQSNAALRAQAREQKLRGMMLDLARLRAQSRTLDGLEGLGRPAYLWWIEESEKLISGQDEDLERSVEWRPGLTDVQAKIAELRRSDELLPYTDEDRRRDFETHPLCSRLRELERAADEDALRPAKKVSDLQTLVRSHAARLGSLAWPSESEVATRFEQDSHLSGFDELNRAAWTIVAPEEVRADLEGAVRGMLLARRALQAADADNVAMARNTYAWSLVWLGRYEEAIVESQRAVSEAAARRADWFASNLARIREEASRWSIDSRAARANELEQWSAELMRCIERLDSDNSTIKAKWAIQLAELRSTCSARRTWRFRDSQFEWWHSLLVTLEADLTSLAKMLAVARDAHLTDKARARWTEAIEGIALAPKYVGLRWPGGTRISQQLGLLPLGINQATGLWEFVHLQSGTEPELGPDGRVRRDADGNLTLTPETGLVFVLLPSGRVPTATTGDGQQDWITKFELAPFFLSKFELTREQWNRLSMRQGDAFTEASPLLPATDINWEEVSTMLQREMGWCRFPSEAQWEYGCRAGTTTRWWSGDDSIVLEGVANANHQSTNGHRIRPCGSLRANPFGLHDVHGNAWEWCGDTFAASAPGRAGDGLRDHGIDDSERRVIRGGCWLSEPSDTGSGYQDGRASRSRYGEYSVRLARSVTP